MEGKLDQHPLAELIREIIDSELSGALRLSREAAKVAVYFDAGQPIFAASNLRVHRLRQVLKRSGFSSAALDKSPAKATDEELAKALIASGDLKPEALQKIRTSQASDVLRVALLWTDGDWHFDQRVRIAAELRVPLDLKRLLLESARHLSFEVVKARLADANAGYSLGCNDESINLSPAESFVLTRASAAGEVFRLSDLLANGLSEEDYLRGVYALALSGILRRLDWEYALKIKRTQKPKAKKVAEEKKEKPAAPSELSDVEAFLLRLKSTRDYYEVLSVARVATPEEIKDAYHKLARQYHPDRFHQMDADLRDQIGSAFVRIGQAYEVLSDAAQRASYDKKKREPTPAAPVPEKAAAPEEASATLADTCESRAEISFKRGLEALARNQMDEAIRLLAEAAALKPGEARYRAEYGRALSSRSNSRRIAENELQAAVTLEPNNSSYRVMLAELYQRVGLRRRAETEAARALTADPHNQAARALLSSLKNR